MATAPTERAIRPQPGPQELFVRLNVDIAVYGGAAGGGKTRALLMKPLYYRDNPHFDAVIFRRTMPQVTNPGGLWDESVAVYGPLGAEPRETAREWTFPSGARVKFAAIQYEADKLQWQGAQATMFGFDELSHFSLGQFLYVGMSRGRSSSGIPSFVRATVNPDAESWVAEFLAWWIDQETGFAIRERAGVVRYVTRDGERWAWADTARELFERFPHHFVDPDTGAVSPPKSVTFVPARLSDNPALLRGNPGYRASLMMLPLVERQRLLEGNWKVKAEAGKIFDRAWFEVVDHVPDGGDACRGWDLAATAKEIRGSSGQARARRDPDYTAGVLIRRVKGVYYVTDCFAKQMNVADSDRWMTELAGRDDGRASAAGATYRVAWEVEPGSAGIREDERLTVLLSGYRRGGRRATGDKYVRSKRLAVEAEAGNVKLLRGAWNEEWLTHMHHQPDLPHDDIHDATALAFNELDGGAGVWVRDYAGVFRGGERA